MESIESLDIVLVEPLNVVAQQLAAHLSTEPGWNVTLVPDVASCLRLPEAGCDLVVVGPTLASDELALDALRVGLVDTPLLPAVVPSWFAVSGDVPVDVPVDEPVSDEPVSDEVQEGSLRLRLWPRLAVVEADPAVAAVLGLPLEDVLGNANRLFRAIAAEDMAAVEQALQRAVGEPCRVEFRMLDADGEARRIEFELEPGEHDPDEGALLQITARSLDVHIQLGRSAEEIMADLLPGRLPSNLGDLLELVVAQTDLGGRRVTLDIEETIREVDAHVVQEAIAAVLDNVRRHTPSDTAVHVTMANTIGGALVSVSDDGPGMRWPGGCAAGRYGMADVATLAGTGGTGIAALHAAARAHAGRTTIQSSPDRGTTVRLLLHDRVSGQQAQDRSDTPSRQQTATDHLVAG